LLASSFHPLRRALVDTMDPAVAVSVAVLAEGVVEVLAAVAVSAAAAALAAAALREDGDGRKKAGGIIFHG
jgi:hypothetical protein